MRREKLKLIMGILLIGAVWALSGSGVRVQRAAQMKLERAHKSKHCVVIDPGHGGSDPGKVSATGTEEKNVNLAVALRLKELLEAQDVTVYMTRMEDQGLYSSGSVNKKAEDLKKRCAIIHEKQPDCAVSIHQNSYHEQGVSGAQVFYYTGSQEGQKLAEWIQESLVKRLDPNNHRKAKNNSSYYMLKKTDVPLTIVECGFLSDPREAELLIQTEYQERAAWAIHLGILKFLNSREQ